MIKLKQAVVVEGKYDKIKLSSIIDAPIIVTNGFSVFNDKEKLKYIRKAAATRGIIIMTDSDNAGFMIRNRIKKAVDKSSEVINVYIPDIYGKEKRKKAPGAEGKIGVEGIDSKIIIDALKKYGVLFEKSENKKREISKTDLFTFGLTGGEGSGDKRKTLLRELDLPENMTTNTLLEAINIFLSYSEFEQICNKIFKE